MFEVAPAVVGLDFYHRGVCMNPDQEMLENVKRFQSGVSLIGLDVIQRNRCGRHHRSAGATKRGVSRVQGSLGPIGLGQRRR